MSKSYISLAYPKDSLITQHFPSKKWLVKDINGDFPGGWTVKNLPARAGEVGSIPGLERYPGEENGSPLLYFCLENPSDRVAWQGFSPQGHKRDMNLVTKQQKILNGYY